MDGNASGKAVRSLFHKVGGVFAAGELLSSNQPTCCKIDKTDFGAEEVDFFYLAGNACQFERSRVERPAPLSFPYHIDRSADFLFRKRAPPIEKLQVVAASDHAQLNVTLAFAQLEEPSHAQESEPLSIAEVLRMNQRT
mmetsp:Transcript_7586/g.19342  ORF Transcript_7586/g.19342 Transcript_7586/m.19342 type:complete len:139 (+) Transcript_7586:196-612(+)